MRWKTMDSPISQYGIRKIILTKKLKIVSWKGYLSGRETAKAEPRIHPFLPEP